MLAKLHTFSLLGIDALPVEVEVDVSPGTLPKTVLVGLPEQAVKKTRIASSAPLWTTALLGRRVA
jgi:magnesium chelatase family protein